MTQLLDHLPEQQLNRRILCYYRNDAEHIRVARIENVANWYFERVVFPGERLLFEAVPGALLEIYSGAAVGNILEDRIPCNRLRAQQK